MAYKKTLWKNGVFEKPRTFKKQDNADGTLTLIPAFGQTIQEGTKIEADVMNNIEVGIENLDKEMVKKADKDGTLQSNLNSEKLNGKTATKTPLTTEKTDLIGMVNELFTNANSLKSDWAEVIGSPLLSTDTSAQLKSKTQTLKNTMATNLTNKGQTSSGSESLSNLINKIPNIATGKRVLSGTTKISDTGDIKVPAYGKAYVTISGVDFTPSMVIAQTSRAGETGYNRLCCAKAANFGYLVQYQNLWGGETNYSMKKDNFYIQKIGTNVTIPICSNYHSEEITAVNFYQIDWTLIE